MPAGALLFFDSRFFRFGGRDSPGLGNPLGGMEGEFLVFKIDPLSFFLAHLRRTQTISATMTLPVFSLRSFVLFLFFFRFAV